MLQIWCRSSHLTLGKRAREQLNIFSEYSFKLFVIAIHINLCSFGSILLNGSKLVQDEILCYQTNDSNVIQYYSRLQYLSKPLTVSHGVSVGEAEAGQVDHAIGQVNVEAAHCRLQVAQLV